MLRLVVGTHALIQDSVEFQDLALVVVDEQHRFGIEQRAKLLAKGDAPDALVMTATPIPRTLALTAYGDLDTSIMREMPPGRHPIKTIAKPESRREEIYEFIQRQLDERRQAYVIYPLVEESSKVDLKAATAMADHLSHDVFPAYRVALLHGRMKQDAKDRVMSAFARGDFDVLVATTVVEVGVDVANASVMLIEHAERFGLSQLHQLRGRVGRGRLPGLCLLVTESEDGSPARERLAAVASTTDGFELSRADLEMRREGDVLGDAQSGARSSLRMLTLVKDEELIGEAREEATRLVARDPDLTGHPPLTDALTALLPEDRAEYLDKT